ncbi:alpha/beta fold hydrolase [Streptomyces daghestanicus]|uniref:Alpha/beta hydrolase n=1 Tax=Streptomyces daghestanicus TaxID=66885 RepID=A0ABQ3PVV3_9ACTN|nr:alpha/beta fold hydrolase [Streptomyces daghestanicus]GGU52850.1 alpha/beta hydrolase [Streptomyces daghestanicus]GHI29155.1 alpha/beta hydrolase [Streptomyces daghestanicus]
MSRHTPPTVLRTTLRTSRGDFAALESAPAAEVRGTAMLLPGYTKGKDDFLALLPYLRDAGYRAVAVDGRGQDETAGPADEAAYRYDALAADVLAQAEAVGTRVHLVGHSMGGQVARAAVLRNARPFLSLTLLSSGPGHVGEGRRLQIELLTGALATMTMEQVWEAMRKLRPSTASEPELEVQRARWLRTNPIHLLVAGRELLGEPDRTAQLAALTELPTHMLYGDQDDTWAPDLLADTAHRLGARHTVMTDTRHSPHVERAARTAAELTRFWDGLRQTPASGR